MKKTLAILLALIMSASVALASCDDKEKEKETQDDFNKDFGTEQTDVVTDENGETVEVTDADESDEDYTPGNNSGSSSNMQTLNDKVYVLHAAAIREKTKTSSDKVGDVPFGAELTRTEGNSNWSKVKYTDKNGKTIEGYINNDVITTSKDAVTFKDETSAEEGVAVMTKIKDAETLGAKNAIIRKYPLAVPSDGFEVLDADEFNEKSIVAQIPAGTEVELVSVSADGKWAYVKGKGNKPVNGEYPENPVDVEGYTAYNNLEVAGSNTSNGAEDVVG